MTQTKQSDTRTWIITGASTGFGRALAKAVLAAGDRVVLAVRTPDSVKDIEVRFPDRCASVRFDACDASTIEPVAALAMDRFGSIDVLVNNAGRGLVGSAEEVTDSQLREQMELHLFGPAALVRAVLPVMRKQGTGTIVQMSSQGGRVSFPGVSAYSASKFALEGWTEALAGEVLPFGIGVMILEPSRFRTSFNSADVLGFAKESDTYGPMLTGVRADMAGVDGLQEGDPDRAAGIIVSMVRSGDVPLRLPLGGEAVERISAGYRRGLAGIEQWAATARSADFVDAAAPARSF